MKCIICRKGETKSGKATVTLERDGRTIVVKNVPADVCSNCGEEYVSDSITAKLLSDANEISRGGTLVDIREYIAA